MHLNRQIGCKASFAFRLLCYVFIATESYATAATIRGSQCLYLNESKRQADKYWFNKFNKIFSITINCKI